MAREQPIKGNLELPGVSNCCFYVERPISVLVSGVRLIRNTHRFRGIFALQVRCFPRPGKPPCDIISQAHAMQCAEKCYARGIDIKLCDAHKFKIMSPEAIKKLRESRNWSQQQLAEMLGVDQATVSRIERGSEPRGPVKRLLERIMAEPAEDSAITLTGGSL